MWPIDYHERLHEWRNLRMSVQSMDLERALLEVNNWWFQAPMVNHHIHRDDVDTWPDPWQLLNDNLFCDLARALGIVYTLIDCKHKDITQVDLAYTDQDNLVLINQGIYILNWAPRALLNMSSQEIQPITRIISSDQVAKKYN